MLMMTEVLKTFQLMIITGVFKMKKYTLYIKVKKNKSENI